MKNLIFILTILFIFSNCTREIPLDLGNSSEIINKIVITSLVSLEKKDTFYLGYTYDVNSFFLSQNEFLDTKIEIYNETTSLGFLNDLSHGRFTLPNNILLATNKNYKLKVTAQKNHVVEASFSIPQKTIPYNAYWEFFAPPTGFETRSFEFSFKDDGNTKNYYEVMFLTTSYVQFRDSTSLSFMNEVNVADPVIYNEGETANQPNTFVFSDELFNGKTYHFKMKMDNSGSDLKTIKGIFLDDKDSYLIFRTITESYYLFKKSLAKHRANQVIIPYTISDIDFDIIFPGEPSELYTNVTGGYGIVAGYQEVIIPFIEK